MRENALMDRRVIDTAGKEARFNRLILFTSQRVGPRQIDAD